MKLFVQLLRVEGSLVDKSFAGPSLEYILEASSCMRLHFDRRLVAEDDLVEDSRLVGVVDRKEDRRGNLIDPVAGRC